MVQEILQGGRRKQLGNTQGIPHLGNVAKCPRRVCLMLETTEEEGNDSKTIP
jgi:hypothetical protein